VGACLPKCISLKHFTDEQIVAEMIGAMRTMKDFEAIPAEVAA
jgi:hypothetical protein